MNLVVLAQKIFQTEKPTFFVEPPWDYEGVEHNETLMKSSLETIGLAELGNPGWDPLCFCSEEGMKYFFPALVRLSLDTIDDDFYFEQLLFHLGYGGQKNRFLNSCSTDQKEFVSMFLNYMIENHAEKIDKNFEADTALEVQQLWHDK